jgi:hypothetical protein
VMDKTIILPCDCGCGILKLTKFDDSDVSFDDMPYLFELYSSLFYEKQGNIFSLLWQRIKGAWFMLNGKEFHLYDIVVQKDKFKEFADFVDSIKE